MFQKVCVSLSKLPMYAQKLTGVQTVASNVSANYLKGTEQYEKQGGVGL